MLRLVVYTATKILHILVIAGSNRLMYYRELCCRVRVLLNFLLIINTGYMTYCRELCSTIKIFLAKLYISVIAGSSCRGLFHTAKKILYNIGRVLLDFPVITGNKFMTYCRELCYIARTLLNSLHMASNKTNRIYCNSATVNIFLADVGL
jgi:hypothetical protein